MDRDHRTVAHPLTHVRRQRGWTLGDVAQIVQRRSGLNMSAWRQKVYRWERGTIPEIEAQLALAIELGVDLEMVHRHQWPDWLSFGDGITDAYSPWTTDAATSLLEDTALNAHDDRRGYLIMPASTLRELANRWGNAKPLEVQSGLDGRRIGSAVVQWATTRGEQLWAIDDLLGGGGTLQLAAADLGLIAGLIKNASYDMETGRKLYQLAADVSRTAGWAAFDAGHHAAAQRYLHASLRAAHVANDRPFGAYTLSMFALQAIYARQGAAAIDVITAAKERTTDLTALAMLETWAARAYAVDGDARQSGKSLSHADDLWDRRSPDAAPRWAYWMIQPSLTAEANTALIELGQFQQAEARINEGLALVADSAPRDMNLYLIRLAEVRLAQGRPDEAIEVARQAVDASLSVDSNRVDDRVSAFARKLPRSPEAAAFQEFLSSIAQSSSAESH